MSAPKPSHPLEAQVAHLDAAIESVVRDYRAFLEAAPSRSHHEDTKTYTAFHTACRAALTHLNEVLKLSRAARPVDAAEAEDIAALLVEARAVLAAHAHEEEANSDEGPAG